MADSNSSTSASSSTSSSLVQNSTKTSKGTKIVRDTNSMDKNAFLKILTAELSNQDPTQQKDSTAYIAQMAQFASLEQLANLNTSITFTAASSSIGKNVTLNTKDSMGNYYTGLVKSISKSGDDIKINVDVTENGKTVTKSFDYKDVTEIKSV